MGRLPLGRFLDRTVLPDEPGCCFRWFDIQDLESPYSSVDEIQDVSDIYDLQASSFNFIGHFLMSYFQNCFR
jgi:hypothetical protein